MTKRSFVKLIMLRKKLDTFLNHAGIILDIQCFDIMKFFLSLSLPNCWSSHDMLRDYWTLWGSVCGGLHDGSAT